VYYEEVRRAAVGNGELFHVAAFVAIIDGWEEDPE